VTRKIVLNFLILTLLVSGVQAATYHVSKNGSDSRSGLDWNNAWATLDMVNSSMSGGDTVFFGAGTWYGVIVPPTGASFSDRTCYACSSFVPGITTISAAEEATGWTLHSGSIYKASFTTISDWLTLYTVAEDDSLMDRESSL